MDEICIYLPLFNGDQAAFHTMSFFGRIGAEEGQYGSVSPEINGDSFCTWYNPHQLLSKDDLKKKRPFDRCQKIGETLNGMYKAQRRLSRKVNSC